MKSLFARIMLASTVLMLALMLALGVFLEQSHRLGRDKVQQSLHRELSAHMAHINPMLSRGVTSDSALKEAFHDFMLLGPSFEIYTLSQSGQVLAFDAAPGKVVTPQVDLSPIQRFLRGDALPITGTDPRSEKLQKIFSVSELKDPGGQLTGYLYVIIGGEIYDSWHALLTNDIQSRGLGAGMLLAIGFVMALFLLLAKVLSAPLKRLSRDLDQLRQAGQGQATLPGHYGGGAEIDSLATNINALLGTLSAQHQKLASQQAARQQFLLHLSHDLKTPLTSLLGYLETYLITAEKQRDIGWLEAGMRSGEKLKSQLGELLELAALENGQIRVNSRLTPLKPILDELEQCFAPKARQKQIRLNIAKPGELQLHTDPQLLGRVLSNLLDNALRYTPRGGEISISIQSGEQITLSVRDTGPGMGAEQQAAWQTPADGELPQLGVGLSIVRQLTGLLGMKLMPISRPRAGCEFRIELPV
ncbi:HAMP domain-containing histidine kinase [Shewanella sp. JM162201]|uniref:histidine kinase n=1 Tax=Shewanella jiangmenensis TaxID=2837387 RepID=A0ABS5V0N0_9GAMM|nr:HAMP domain-containing sensor histidine kinase [Shewanella jiangmenensis]MBT1444024.1 HAMP domain-containing histidine kinase [Shewanella jiangmenensis]